jgi:hypothetical protein
MRRAVHDVQGRLRARTLAARLLLAAALAAAAAPGAARAQDAEILTLQHRLAEDVLPRLRPFLDPQGTLEGHGQRLTLRTTRQNSAQLKALLANLDRAPRKLLVSVREDRPPAETGESRAADGSMTVDSRRAAQDGPGNARTDRALGRSQQLQVLEGERVTIRFDTAVPLRLRRFVIDAQGVTEVRGTAYYDTTTAVIVRPILVAETVSLEISPAQPPEPAGDGTAAMSSTTVSGRLGEWIAVGGAQLREPPSPAAGTRAFTTTQTDQRGAWVRVDALDDSGR